MSVDAVLQYGSLGLLALVLLALGKIGQVVVSAHLAALQAMVAELKGIAENVSEMRGEHNAKLDSILARSRDSKA